MARPVLIIACIAFVLSLGALPYNPYLATNFSMR